MLTGTLLLMTLPVSPVLPAWAQQDATPTEQAQNEDFFSGVVTELSAGKITVLRPVVGKNSETRTFLIVAETHVEGKLRMKARVTVRYTHDEDSNRALHIIVRSAQKK